MKTQSKEYILWVKSQEDQCLSFLPENAHLSSFLEGGEKLGSCSLWYSTNGGGHDMLRGLCCCCCWRRCLWGLSFELSYSLYIYQQSVLAVFACFYIYISKILKLSSPITLHLNTNICFCFSVMIWAPLFFHCLLPKLPLISIE